MIYDDEQGGDSYGEQRRSAERGCGYMIEMAIIFIAVVIVVAIIASVAANAMPR